MGERERRSPVDAMTYPRHRLDYYGQRVRDEWKAGQPIRICVAAHSHSPLVYTHLSYDHCWFVDAGAWTEGRSDFAVITNHELAVSRYSRVAARATVPVKMPILVPGTSLAG